MTTRQFPGYENDYARHLLRLEKLQREVSELCLNNRFVEALEKIRELSAISTCLEVSMRAYIEWQTPVTENTPVSAEGAQ